MIEAYINIQNKLGDEVQKSWGKLVGFIRAYYVMEELWDGNEILKFRKSGKTLVSLSVHENRFNALIIFGKAEREKFDAVRDNFSDYILNYYDNSRTYHDGKWMFIDVDSNTNIDEIVELIKIKKKPNRKVENLKDAEIGCCGNRCDQCLLRATNGGKENRVLFNDENYKIYFSPDEQKEDYSSVNCAGCYQGCKTRDCAKEKDMMFVFNARIILVKRCQALLLIPEDAILDSRPSSSICSLSRIAVKNALNDAKISFVKRI